RDDHCEQRIEFLRLDDHFAWDGDRNLLLALALEPDVLDVEHSTIAGRGPGLGIEQLRQVPTLRQAMCRYVADSTQMLVLVPLAEARRKPRLDCRGKLLCSRFAGVVLIPISHGT